MMSAFEVATFPQERIGILMQGINGLEKKFG